MCCCKEPTINRTAPIKMTSDTPAFPYPPNPPELSDTETLLYDEPGRCGGSDSHAYHFRVTADCSRVYLLVRHGGGDERMIFGWKNTTLPALAALDSNGRYWLLCAAYHGMKYASNRACDTERAEWQKAAAEKRIRTRKQPNRGFIKVWIEPAAPTTKEVAA